MPERDSENKCEDYLFSTESLPDHFDPNGDPKESYRKAAEHFEKCKTGVHPDLKKPK